MCVILRWFVVGFRENVVLWAHSSSVMVHHLKDWCQYPHIHLSGLAGVGRLMKSFLTDLRSALNWSRSISSEFLFGRVGRINQPFLSSSRHWIYFLCPHPPKQFQDLLFSYWFAFSFACDSWILVAFQLARTDAVYLQHNTSLKCKCVF